MAQSPQSRTVRLTMSQALVKYLQVQFSERDGTTHRLIPAMFGIFGHGNVHALGQALYEYGQDLPYYRPCNEQSMVHTAAAFAKTKLRMSTLACTSSIGPGATNMITGGAGATINRLPVLLLPSDYYATRHQGPVLQQLEHPISADVSVNDCFRPISRFFDRISRPEQLLTALPEAMRVLIDPVETGAVTLSLPQDVQAHAYDYPTHFFENRVWQGERRSPDSKRIDEAVKLLKESARPMIIAGGGVFYSEALDELQEFAETFGIPVGETFAGHGTIRNGSDIALGSHGTTGTSAATEVAKQADLIIAIGTRLTDVTTGSHSSFQHPEAKFVHINVTGHDAHKMGALPIIADAREALRALTKAATEAGIKPNHAYNQDVQQAKEDWRRMLKEEIFQPAPGEVMSQAQVVGVLNQESRAGDTVINDAGTLPGDLHSLWDSSNGTNCHLEFGYSCMGYALPAGLGVRMAQPEGDVYVLIGDATYLLSPSELVTAMEENLKVTVIISENHGLQAIRGLQESRTGHSFGNEFRARDSVSNLLEGEYVEIDFARNAASMGARTWRVTTPDQLRAALNEAREEVRSCVIVAETEKRRSGPAPGAWWDLSVAETTGDPATQGAQAEYEEGKRLQRFYY